MLKSRFTSFLVAILVIAGLLVVPLPTLTTAQDRPANSSQGEAQLVNYLVEVIDKIIDHHPEGGQHSKQDYINGARDAVVKALILKPDLPADQKEKLVAFLKGKQFTSVTQLVHVLDRFSRSFTKLNMEAVCDTAAQGALSVTGDQFCRILTFEQIQKMQQMMMSNEDKSIGLSPQPIPTDDPNHLRLEIGHIRRGYLAFAMGLQEHDEILAVNGKKITDVAREQINDLFNAEVGQTVTIVIKREGFANPITVVGVQATNDHPAAMGTLLPGGIGYVTTNMFSMDLHTAVRSQIDRLNADNAVKALILDLRNNPGGAMPACTQMADDFLPEGQVITTTKGTYENPLGALAQLMGQGDDGEKVNADTTVYRTKTAQRYSMPLIVLINKMSASASEMLSGCLKSHERAIVVGETSYGKGIGQTAIPLSNGPTGSGGLGGMMMGGGQGMRFLYMTVMTYFGPKGELVHHIGISPNVEVSSADPDARLFDKLAKFRADGTIAKYLDANFAANEAFFTKQISAAPSALSEFPALNAVRNAARSAGLSDATLARELRREIQLRAAGEHKIYNLADDAQLQAAIKIACDKAGINAGSIEQYSGFAR